MTEVVTLGFHDGPTVGVIKETQSDDLRHGHNTIYRVVKEGEAALFLALPGPVCCSFWSLHWFCQVLLVQPRITAYGVICNGCDS